jgi:hypothetical protein
MSKPDYIRFPGCPIAELPADMYDNNSYYVLIKGKTKNLQSMVDLTLNSPFDDKYKLKVVSAYVTFIFNESKTRCITEPYSFMGNFDEMNMVAAIAVMGEDGKQKRLFFNTSHYWVANAFAMINGRELVGCNKIICQYEMPKHDALPERFSCTIDTMHPMGADAHMKPFTLFEMNMKCPGNELDLMTPLGMTKLMDILNDDVFDCSEQEKAEIISQLVGKNVDMIMLKQFPDGKGEKAVYQGLMNAVYEHKNIRSAKLLLHEFEFITHYIESFQLNDMFGIEPGVHTPHLVVQLYGDFIFHIADELA